MRHLRIIVQMVLIAGVIALLWPATLGGKVNYVMVSGTSMEPKMHTGDLVLVREQGGYEVGDAIAYEIPAGEVGAGSVVIHRITGGDGATGFRTQGDNRDTPDVWRPTEGDVLGKRQLLVPQAGVLVAKLRNPLPLAILAAVVVFFSIGWKPKTAEVEAADDSVLTSPPATTRGIHSLVVRTRPA